MVDAGDLPSTTLGAGYHEPFVVRGTISSSFMYYVYVLQSKRASGGLYVGRTEDLRQRMREHIAGKTWTTKRMLPVELIFYEAFKSKEDTIRRERYLKSSKGKSTLNLMLRNSLQV